MDAASQEGVEDGARAVFATSGGWVPGFLIVELPDRLFARCDRPIEGPVRVSYRQGRARFSFASHARPSGSRYALDWPARVVETVGDEGSEVPEALRWVAREKCR